MTIDAAWDAVEAPIWVPEVRVAAQVPPGGCRAASARRPRRGGTAGTEDELVEKLVKCW